MLNRKRFEQLKLKPNPSMQDLALLICTVERLFHLNDCQADELKKCLKSLDTLERRLQWYRQTSIKEVTRES